MRPAAAGFAVFSRADFLFLHKTGEFFFVYGYSLFAHNLLCKVNRESESIVKFECVGTRKHGLSALFKLVYKALQY